MVIGAGLLFSTLALNQYQKKPSTLFSWSIENNTQELIDQYEEPLKIERIFQYAYPQEYTDGTLREYAQTLKERELSLYALDGGPNWGTTEDGYMEMTDFIDQTAAFNRGQGRDARLEGIVLDVEPVQAENWAGNETEMMKRYVDYMIQAYEYAASKGLKVVVCVTYWYDEQFPDELRRLIEEGCDEVAVMNYYRGKEIEHIETEVAMAKDVNKPILNIFEFDQPDHEGLFDQNTYYEQGPDAAQDVFKEMDRHFNYDQLTPAWHQLR